MAMATEAWAAGHGARFLAGAVKNVPSAVGEPDTLLYCSGDYTDAASSVNLFLAGAAHDDEFRKETGVETDWLAPLNDLVRRAVDAGHGEHSIAALTEVLKGAGPGGALTPGTPGS
ncbi:hypothetical protein GCM10010387_18280 [Streptomyces inusitatus]|uniref:NADPH-dependent reductive aminase-like C-terminal domain-containing protein n=1 Tax=Streptomyces inusitatus TaxID=68221 RepID=A0A918UPU8_9ACTN|nr:hypothetical protein [Streptomyces inusitatus]GGZ25143.1 hypothetical protein GCM10010387_18280 [Streptomyces inusitatus]